MSALTPAELDALCEVVGSEHVLVSNADVATFGRDYSDRFRGRAAAVVLPASTAEVAAIVRRCRDTGTAIVPQGGNTGLVGGGVPLAGEIVVSLSRMTRHGDVDRGSGQLTVGAGVTLAAAQRAAAAAGWAYGVDFASRERCTIGGNIATNAGGLHVLRHGDTRAQVLGVEAVLGNGSVVSHMAGLVKDNTGYHLPSLLCGSEGTLGIVTGARLRLVPRADERAAALLAFQSTAAAVEAAGEMRRRLPAVSAIELILADGVDLVCTVEGTDRPFSSAHEAYLIVEVADTSSRESELREATASLSGVQAVALGSDRASRHRIWRYRMGHTDAINTLGPPHKLDVALPTPALAAFVEAVPAVVHAVAPSARVWRWGHVADGNVHVNVTGVDPDDERVDEAVFAMVAQQGGSISAEHGIGTAKRRWLHLNRSPTEIAAFRALKSALDPDGVLNPNVLLPPQGHAESS